MPRCAVALRSLFQNGMVVAWHGRDMACVNETRPHCVNQKERHNLNPSPHGMAGERHGMCELALNVSSEMEGGGTKPNCTNIKIQLYIL
jgi:hypothetical protein